LIERTLVVVKPDGVRRGLTEEVISRIQKAGLKIVSKKRMALDRQTAERLYEIHRGKYFFEKLIVHVIWGNVVVMMVEGERAIKRVRELAGATDWKQAEKGTIRRDFAETITANIIHASDSPKNAKRELAIFFH
jgi:nucleoside-diphosphate kinase